MNIGKIIGDSVKYPLSNWKNFLILGIIFVISSLYLDIGQLGANTVIIGILGVIGFIVGLLSDGYTLRIIKSSLADFQELPEFNAWVDMFIDGIKVFIVSIVYLIPAILIIAFAALSFGSALIGIISHPSSTPSAAEVGAILNVGILILIAALYMVIILPIAAIATANMAYYESKLSAAFRLGEIFNKIGNIGWLSFILWYIATGIIYLVLIIIGSIITGFFNIINPIIGGLILSLIVIPYTTIFVIRSVALVYKSE